MRIADCERFGDKVQISSGCWEWTGGRNDLGRGYFWLKGKTMKAARIAWNIYNGVINDGLCVLHKCDNGGCVNPDHLFLGTYKDNTKDMFNKGRAVVPEGEQHWRAKLTKEDIRDIRYLFNKGYYLQKELASMFGLSRGYVSEIVNNKAWKHI